ncbi:MAG: DUF2069 domain-containing protein [Azoarcus sp.]|nr:DUF2069 domain-containing protein [Azoarcus sp.]
MRPRTWSRLVNVALIALLALCVLWEGWLAPLWPGGSLLIFKAMPLTFALYGVWHGRRYTSQWLSMVTLFYFLEGAWRMADPGLTGALARVEIALSVTLFVATVGHAHSKGQETDVRQPATKPPVT